MADESIKQQIHDVLKQNYFTAPDDMVDVSDGPDDSVHLILVSRRFDGMRLKAKHELVSNLLVSHLSEDVWQRISLTICKSPDEIKAFA
jgi:stress-induced morphogen